MIKLSKKSFLPFLSAIAMAAFAMPSMASAANFDGVGQHTLTATNLGFDAPFLGASSTCTSTVFEVNVATGGASATVQNATFSGCTGSGTAAGAADVVGTGFPWTITRTAAGTFTIDGVDIDATFTGPGLNVTLEGSIDGSWNNTTHTGDITGRSIQLTSALGNGSATVTNGDIRDDQNSLAVT
jgi:hypothetical protein